MHKLFITIITTGNQSMIGFCQLHQKHNQITNGNDKKTLRGHRGCNIYMYQHETRKETANRCLNIIDIKQCVECDKEKEEILRLELH